MTENLLPNGIHACRLATGRDEPREVAFIEAWAAEHKMRDLLGSLFTIECESKDPDVIPASLFSTFGPRKMPIGDPTERDRIVASTVVQWLGSNVGMGFLQSALNKAGYDMVKRERIRATR